MPRDRCSAGTPYSRAPCHSWDGTTDRARRRHGTCTAGTPPRSSTRPWRSHTRRKHPGPAVTTTHVLKTFFSTFFLIFVTFLTYFYFANVCFCFYLFLSDTYCRPARQSIVKVVCVSACNSKPRNYCKIPLSTSSSSYLELRFRY